MSVHKLSQNSQEVLDDVIEILSLDTKAGAKAQIECQEFSVVHSTYKMMSTDQLGPKATQAHLQLTHSSFSFDVPFRAGGETFGNLGS